MPGEATPTTDLGAPPPGASEGIPSDGSDEPRPDAGERAPEDGLGGRSWSRRDLGVAGLIGLVTAVLTWVFRTEIVSTDPWHYVMAALEFPQDSWVPLGYTRYGMILPLGPLVVLWGYVPAIFYAPAIVASGVLASCVYLVGRRFWGRLAGLTAVLLLLSNWIVFINLSRFYPDIPSMALVLAALVLAIEARARQLSQRRFGNLLPIAVGFLLGWSFEARETALFAWPAVIAVLWVRGRVVRNAVLTALPVVAWAAVDMTIGAVAYGDALLKLHTFTRQDLSATTNPADRAVMDQFVGLPRLDYLTMIPRLIVERQVPGGVWFLVLAGLALLALVVRNAAVRLVAASFVLSYVLFVGVSGFFVPSHPAGRLDVQRYWIQFIPWIALAVAGALHVVVEAVFKRWKASGRRWVYGVASLALIVGPIVALVPAAAAAPSLAINGGAPLAGVSAEIGRLRPSAGVTVFSDWQTLRILPIYQRDAFGGTKQWSARLRSLNANSSPKPGDYVLLVRTTSSPCGFCAGALEPWLKAHPQVPSSWERVYASEGDGYVLYAVR